MLDTYRKVVIPVVAGLCASMTMPALAAGKPVIGKIEGLVVDSYCTFLPSEREFVYADESTWWFLFLSDLGQDGIASMKLDGAQRELRLNATHSTDAVEVRSYESADDTPYVVTVTMLAGEVGYEHTNYTGAIHVSHNGAASAVAFHGDCGV